MANALCSTPINSFMSHHKPGLISSSNGPKAIRIIDTDLFRSSRTAAQSLSVVTKASDSNPTPSPTPTPTPSTKPVVNSIVCSDCEGNDCEGNGAVACSQCKGTGVNSVDHFNGQFKAGGLCWLCRGKRDMLCGHCNGAGFKGGFMSTYDE